MEDQYLQAHHPGAAKSHTPVTQTDQLTPVASPARVPSWNKGQSLQPKLKVSMPGDMYEQEADRVAEHVMRAPAPHLQRQADASDSADAPSLVHNVLDTPGQPLDAGVRASMEGRFSTDFGDVRVHADSQAAQSAEQVSAKAYTVGQNVVFGAGQYAPGTDAGSKLVAHELTHVVQQRESPIASLQRQSAGPGMPGPAPQLGGITLTFDLNGRVDLTVSGPEETPVVSGPTLGIRRNANGTYTLLIGGKGKVVAASDIPKMLRDALGADSQSGQWAAGRTLRFPSYRQLRSIDGTRFVTYLEYKVQVSISSVTPVMPLSEPVFDALIELYRSFENQSMPVKAPPQINDLPPLLPDGQAYA